MPIAFSKDGTAIAYEKTGSGPGLILVNGALSDRKMLKDIDFVSPLAKNFTVITYDRRGRGESKDTKPYAVEREIEDIETLLKEVNGQAYLFGSSSGAVLALRAAEKLGPEKILKLALYEPPYRSDGEKGQQEFAEEKKKVNELVLAGAPGDAITFFLGKRGVPPEKMQELKASPNWEEMENMEHTLVYDFDVLGNGIIPVDVAKRITFPTLIMDGEKSFDFIHSTANKLQEIIPGAVHKMLKDQTHQVSPEVLAPALKEFFT